MSMTSLGASPGASLKVTGTCTMAPETRSSGRSTSLACTAWASSLPMGDALRTVYVSAPVATWIGCVIDVSSVVPAGGGSGTPPPGVFAVALASPPPPAPALGGGTGDVHVGAPRLRREECGITSPGRGVAHHQQVADDRDQAAEHKHEHQPGEEQHLAAFPAARRTPQHPLAPWAHCRYSGTG